jgi:hypothetical protein
MLCVLSFSFFNFKAGRALIKPGWRASSRLSTPSPQPSSTKSSSSLLRTSSFSLSEQGLKPSTVTTVYTGRSSTESETSSENSVGSCDSSSQSYFYNLCIELLHFFNNGHGQRHGSTAMHRTVVKQGEPIV